MPEKAGSKITNGSCRINFMVVCVGHACTLRCRDCSNFSIVAQKKIASLYDMDGVIEDLRLITRHAAIDRLHIQGGEPFLHPRLDELLNFVIGNEQITRCEIATNGTMKVSAAIAALLKNEKFCIRISNYPIIREKTIKLDLYCQENNIKYRVHNFVNKETKWHQMGGRDFLRTGDTVQVMKRFANCLFKGCLTLDGHRLGYCSRSTVADIVQDFKSSIGGGGDV